MSSWLGDSYWPLPIKTTYTLSSTSFHIYRPSVAHLYGFSCFCNAPEYLLRKFLMLERRIFRIMGSNFNDFPSFLEVANRTCLRLMSDIEVIPGHPLRSLFDERSGRSLRAKNTLRPPRAKTVRFKNSFIKFSVF